MKVLVTGAGGMLGRAVVPSLLERGYTVSALVRKPEDIEFDHPHLTWVLGDVRDEAVLTEAAKGIDRIVHLAGAKADESDSYAINVGGIQNLIRAAKANTIGGIVNISTMSANLPVRGIYGETKRLADEELAHSGILFVTLKPSVLYTDMESGIFGALARYARLPLTPVIGSGDAAYRPLSAADAALAIEKVLAKPMTNAVYEIGGPDVITFNALAQRIGNEMYRKRVRLVHLPLWFSLAIARALKQLLSRPPITISNVLGAKENIEINIEPFNTAYNFHPRTLAEGFADLKQADTAPVREAYALLRYVFPGHRISPHLAKRYVDALRYYELTRALDASLLQNPRKLMAFDALTKFTHPRGVYQRKLLVAAAVIECSPVSSRALLPRHHSLLSFFGQMFLLGLRSAVALVQGAVLALSRELIERNA